MQGRGDLEIARIADAQRGVIHRAQLAAAGLGRGGIEHRLRVRRLHRIHLDVFLVGRRSFEPLGRETAAVLQVGGYGVLSHQTAGRIWGLVETGHAGEVSLTTVGRDLKSRDRLVLHRSLSLSRADVRCGKNLPVTSPARTLLDLAGILDLHELEAAYAIARRAGLATPKEISAVITRAPRSKGISHLRDLLHADVDAPSQGTQAPTLTRSKYERKLLALIATAQLPRPQANAKVEGREVDLYWPEQKLIVEFDGFGYHSDRAAFERDRERDRQLIAAGYRVIRVTARQLDHTPLATITAIAMALARI